MRVFRMWEIHNADSDSRWVPLQEVERMKAQWQAEALDRCAKGVAACKPGATPQGISIAIKMEADELRRQAEEAP